MRTFGPSHAPPLLPHPPPAAAAAAAVVPCSSSLPHLLLRLRPAHTVHNQLRWCLTPTQPTVAVGETVILLHPPLPLLGFSTGMERGCQQTDSLADGQPAGVRRGR